MQNTLPQYSSKIAMDTLAIHDPPSQGYYPYQAPYSYAQPQYHQPKNIPQRVTPAEKVKTREEPRVGTMPAKQNPIQEQSNNKLKIINNSCRVAIQKISFFITASQKELFDITNAKRIQVTRRFNLDRWLYLQKFQKDYQKLIADLKTKKQFLEILLVRSANVEELPSIQNWLQVINFKYIAQLEKQLVFSEWKQNLNQPQSAIFRMVIQNAKQDPDMMNKAQKAKMSQQPQVLDSKFSKSQINICHPFQSQESINFSDLENQLSGKQHQFNKVIKPTQTLKNHYQRQSLNNQRSHDFNSLQLSSQIKQNQIGSLLSSGDERNSDPNFYVEYSDAQTLKTQSFKRWVQENYHNKSESMNNSLTPDQFQPVMITFNLAGSYHPMTQSQKSNGLNQDALDRSETRSVRM